MGGFNTQPGPRIGALVVCEEALALLKASLAAKLAELAIAFTDYPALSVPADNCWFDWLAEPKYVDTYPAIMVAPGDAHPLGHAIAAPHQDEYKVNRDLVVAVLEAGSDPRDIARRLRVWEFAFLELLGDTDSLDCGHCVWAGTYWTRPRMTLRDSQELVQDLPVFFNVQTYEYTNPTALPARGSDAITVHVQATTERSA